MGDTMTFTERQQRVTNTSGILLFLEITAASFSGPAYIVNDTQDWVSQGRTYIGIPFSFKLPDDVTGQSTRAQLVMSNVGSGFSDELERLAPNEPVMAKMHVSDRANPDAYAQTLFLPMTNVSVSGTTATAICGSDFAMRQQAVRIRQTEFSTPGIF